MEGVRADQFNNGLADVATGGDQAGAISPAGSSFLSAMVTDPKMTPKLRNVLGRTVYRQSVKIIKGINIFHASGMLV